MTLDRSAPGRTQAQEAPEPVFVVSSPRTGDAPTTSPDSVSRKSSSDSGAELSPQSRKTSESGAGFPSISPRKSDSGPTTQRWTINDSPVSPRGMLGARSNSGPLSPQIRQPMSPRPSAKTVSQPSKQPAPTTTSTNNPQQKQSSPTSTNNPQRSSPTSTNNPKQASPTSTNNPQRSSPTSTNNPKQTSPTSTDNPQKSSPTSTNNPQRHSQSPTSTNNTQKQPSPTSTNTQAQQQEQQSEVLDFNASESEENIVYGRQGQLMGATLGQLVGKLLRPEFGEGVFLNQSKFHEYPKNQN